MSIETITSADSLSDGPASAEQSTVLTDQEIFEAHQGGKLSIASTVPLASKRDLSIAYTPGVAQVSRAIHAEPELAKTLTWAQRLVVVVSDGTAVLGLGNLVPAHPCRSWKASPPSSSPSATLTPSRWSSTPPTWTKLSETLVGLRPSFGAVNLEDISAPQINLLALAKHLFFCASDPHDRWSIKDVPIESARLGYSIVIFLKSFIDIGGNFYPYLGADRQIIHSLDLDGLLSEKHFEPKSGL